MRRMEQNQLFRHQEPAVVHPETTEGAIQKRNDAVREIHGLGGDDQARRIWKILKGYHTRFTCRDNNVSHQATDRWKYEKSGMDERQRVEGYIKCLVINKMTNLGMPESSWEQAA